MAPPKTHRTEQRSTHVQSAKSMSTTEKNVLFFLLPLSYGPINLPKKKDVHVHKAKRYSYRRPQWANYTVARARRTP